MPLETATYISELNSSNPAGTDAVLQGDDHLRLLKSVLKAQFPNFTAAALAATNAQVDAASTATDTGVYQANGASGVGAPPFSFKSDTNTGFYRTGEDQLALSLGGVQALLATSAGLDIKLGTLRLAGADAFPLDTPNIGDLKVTTAKLADAAVTYAKIQNVSAQYKMLGRKTAAAGPVEEIGLDPSLAIDGSGNLKIATLTADRSPLGGALNLAINNGSTGGAGLTFKRTITADEAVMVKSDGTTVKATGISVTIDYTANGVNGLDTGAPGNNKGYYEYLISNGTLVKGLASLSATSPSTPGGYDYKLLVGWCPTDGAADLKQVRTRGKRGDYVIGAAADRQIVDSGTNGSIFTPTYITVDITHYIPGVAVEVHGSLADGGGTAIVAPNSNFGAYNSTVNPPPIYVQGGNSQYSFAVESLNLYWASDAAGVLIVDGFTLP